MLLDGYAGYSTCLVCSTDCRRSGTPRSAATHWSLTGRMDRTRCLVVREFGLIVRNDQIGILSADPFATSLFSGLQCSLRTA
jgi:hypothetical protein